MSCSAGRDVWCAAPCLPGNWFCQRSLAFLSAADLLQEIIWQGRCQKSHCGTRGNVRRFHSCVHIQELPLSKARTLPYSKLPGRPVGMQNNFLISAKAVGANVWVTGNIAMQSPRVAKETVILYSGLTA